VASAFAGSPSPRPEKAPEEQSGFKIVLSTPARPRPQEKPQKPKRPASTEDLAERLKREWLKD
jgi:hypothetical protein